MITRAFAENLHPRGTGAQGGQFVAAGSGQAAGAQKQKAATRPRKKIAPGRKPGDMSFDGKRGTGYGTPGGDKRVKALQTALNRLGLTDSNGKPLKVDGKLGPRTTAAIKKAQRKLGIKADGVVTPALLARLSKAKKLEKAKAAKKAVPAKKAAPARVAQPAPKRTGRGGAKAAPRTVQVGRSARYGQATTDLERHGTHNQKSHGNRLGKPTNVGGKTGLAKATAALADKPQLGPRRAAVHPFSKTELRDILTDDGFDSDGNLVKGGRSSRSIDDHRARLEAAGASEEQSAAIIEDFGGDPDEGWKNLDLEAALFSGAQEELKKRKKATGG
jgi:peptidoglycan hydrolase-like protein with peptidoglycan-binding domain